MGGLIPQTRLLPESSWLPILRDGTQLHLGVVVAVLAAVAAYVLLWRTSFGFRLRAVGLSREAATYAGMPVARTTTLALTLSGALCGMAGSMLVFGSVSHRMVTDGSLTGFTGSAGFNGIVVALFGGLNPLWTILSSFVFAGLLVGGDAMQVVTGVPSDLIVALNGLVVVFVVSVEVLRRRPRAAQMAPPSEPPARSAEPRRAARRHPGVGVNEFFTSAILTATVASGIQLAVPFLLAALGETLGQRSGVLNLGVDGIMLLGAFTSYYVALETGDLPLAVLAGLAVGAACGLATAFISVTLRAEQGISGIGVYLFALGLTSLLFLKLVGTPLPIDQPGKVEVPYLHELPIVGKTLFRQDALVYIAFALVPVVAFVLNRTTFGLNVKAVGENPAAADSLGVSVARTRYATVTIGSSLAGLAGATLMIDVGIFQQNITNAVGFIAVALVYFGAWRPVGVMLGALLYGMTQALVLSWKGLGIIPVSLSDLAAAAPAVITVLALLTVARRFRQPAALATPYDTRRLSQHRCHTKAERTTDPRQAAGRKGFTKCASSCSCWPRWRRSVLATPRYGSAPSQTGATKLKVGVDRAERAQRPRVHAVDAPRASQSAEEIRLRALRLGEPVRRRERGEHHPAVRRPGLRPDHRARIAVRRDDRTARTAVPEDVVRVGDGRNDLRPAQRVRVRGELAGGRVRQRLHRVADEQDEGHRRDRPDRGR